MNPVVIVMLVWFALAPIFLVLWLIARRKLKRKTTEAETAATAHKEALAKLTADHEATKAKYAGIISQEVEVARLQGIATSLTSDIERLRASYAEKRALFDRLESQVAIYDERLAFAELGLYEPHFDFTDSEEFKQRSSKSGIARKQWSRPNRRPSAPPNGPWMAARRRAQR